MFPAFVVDEEVLEDRRKLEEELSSEFCICDLWKCSATEKRIVRLAYLGIQQIRPIRSGKKPRKSIALRKISIGGVAFPFLFRRNQHLRAEQCEVVVISRRRLIAHRGALLCSGRPDR